MTPGTKLGPYEIIALIGAGGMGEVYRAVDTKLDREVALKVLPPAFASDSGRMARFEREAKVLASLNHPNIAAIYGVEERALVMELVEGASPKGPMPFDDAWKIASQIAAALEYAHDKGIVHRDLKPDNIKITPDGVVKLLDFGLAKAFTEQKEPSANPEHSPTLTIGATEVGMILGTAAYMSPEQAKGKSVDKRADIWAFGVVLYELLTGERLFKGEDAADTLAQVLTKEPVLDQVPDKARRLLQSCLEKDPRNRLRDIGDAGRLLEDTHPAAPVRSRVNPALAAVAVVLLVALGIVALIHFREAPPPKTVLRYTIALPENTTNLHSFAVSPDGHLLAMAVDVNGKRQLWLRLLDSLVSELVPGTDDAAFPFWSPDSRYIGFFAQGSLKKISASGGPAQSLSEAPNGRGGSWNRDDVIIFAPDVRAAIRRVSAVGGVATDVTPTGGVRLFPVFLADGRHFLYVVTEMPSDQIGIYLSSIDGNENRRFMPDGPSVVIASGQLLSLRENNLVAQRLDTASGQAMGELIPVVAGISPRNSFYYAPVTASQTGVLLYESGSAIGSNQIGWYDRRGKLLDIVGPPGPVLDPAVSPDEKAIVFRRVSRPAMDLWLRDLTRGTEQRFTTDVSANTTPFWSPKGDRIAFASSRNGGLDLYEKSTSGSGKDELLLANRDSKVLTQWSRDGRFLVYTETDPKTRRDIWVLPMDSAADRKPVPFLRSEFNEFQGQLSPDTHWMAYTSDETGQREVYVRPFPAGEGQWKISIAGGEQPRWRGDGKELFFVSADEKMMAVAVKASTGPKFSFEPAVPEALFKAQLARPPNNPLFEYDVTADGKRFLLDTVASDSASTPVLNVVVNWDAGLKK